MPGVHLGIDYGTSNTVAMLRWPDGRVRQLLVDGSSVLPSGVYAAQGGRLRTGREAERSARLDPTRFEPNPKRRIDESEILLGDEVYPIVDVIAATLRRILDDATRAADGQPETITLTYPASWYKPRRAVLRAAAERAGMFGVRLAPEPVAAGLYYAAAVRAVPTGKTLLVYDLGAGTFDATLLRSTGGGFEVLAVDGLGDLGGLDIDGLVVEQIALAVAAGAPDEWARLTNPRTVQDRRHRRTMWDDARQAKESLSSQSSTGILVPLIDRDCTLTREALERAAQPHLQRTVDLTVELIRRAGVGSADIAAVLLVGGATRMPLVSTMLHRGLGLAPTVNEQPELLVAEGSLHVDDAPPAAAPAPGAGMPPVSAPPSGSPVSGAPMSPMPLSPMPVSGAPASDPTSGAPVSGSPVSGMPVSGAPQSAMPAGQLPAGNAPVSGGPGDPARGSATVTAPRAGNVYQAVGPPRTAFRNSTSTRLSIILLAGIIIGGAATLVVIPLSNTGNAAGAIPIVAGFLLLAYVVMRVSLVHRLAVGDWGIRVGKLFGSELWLWRDVTAADVRDGAVWAWPVPGTQFARNGKLKSGWRKKFNAFQLVPMWALDGTEAEVVAALRRYRPAHSPIGYSIPPAGPPRTAAGYATPPPASGRGRPAAPMVYRGNRPRRSALARVARLLGWLILILLPILLLTVGVLRLLKG